VSNTTGYKNSVKHLEWRMPVCNEITSRLDGVCTLGDALVLSLEGKRALTMKEMVGRGFREENFLIAEIDKSAVAHLKANRKATVIGQDIRALVQNMAEGKAPGPVDVLLADFCGSGLADKYETFMQAVFGGAVNPGGVVVINMLRGRFGPGRYNRVFAKAASRIAELEKAGIYTKDYPGNGVHRGLVLMHEVDRYARGSLADIEAQPCWKTAKAHLNEMQERSDALVATGILQRLAKYVSPTTLTYRGKCGVVWMDTLIATAIGATGDFVKWGEYNGRFSDKKLGKIERSSRAKMAVRTRRMNAAP